MELVCGICHEDALRVIGVLDSCKHLFCFDCIKKWSDIESKCPFCKLRFCTISRKQLNVKALSKQPVESDAQVDSNLLPGRILDVVTVAEKDQKYLGDTEQLATEVFASDIENDDDDSDDDAYSVELTDGNCILCGTDEDEAHLLICDGCNRLCHTYCTGLSEVPEGDWFCHECSGGEHAVERPGAASETQQHRPRTRPLSSHRRAVAPAVSGSARRAAAMTQHNNTGRRGRTPRVRRNARRSHAAGWARQFVTEFMAAVGRHPIGSGSTRNRVQQEIVVNESHRRVDALRVHWEAVRRGTLSFTLENRTSSPSSSEQHIRANNTNGRAAPANNAQQHVAPEQLDEAWRALDTALSLRNTRTGASSSSSAPPAPSSSRSSPRASPSRSASGAHRRSGLLARTRLGRTDTSRLPPCAPPAQGAVPLPRSTSRQLSSLSTQQLWMRFREQHADKIVTTNTSNDAGQVRRSAPRALNPQRPNSAAHQQLFERFREQQIQLRRSAATAGVSTSMAPGSTANHTSPAASVQPPATSNTQPGAPSNSTRFPSAVGHKPQPTTSLEPAHDVMQCSPSAILRLADPPSHASPHVGPPAMEHHSDDADTRPHGKHPWQDKKPDAQTKGGTASAGHAGVLHSPCSSPPPSHRRPADVEFAAASSAPEEWRASCSLETGSSSHVPHSRKREDTSGHAVGTSGLSRELRSPKRVRQGEPCMQRSPAALFKTLALAHQDGQNAPLWDALEACGRTAELLDTHLLDRAAVGVTPGVAARCMGETERGFGVAEFPSRCSDPGIICEGPSPSCGGGGPSRQHVIPDHSRSCWEAAAAHESGHVSHRLEEEHKAVGHPEHNLGTADGGEVQRARLRWLKEESSKEVKHVLRPLFDQKALNKEQFKEAARHATHVVYKYWLDNEQSMASEAYRKQKIHAVVVDSLTAIGVHVQCV